MHWSPTHVLGAAAIGMLAFVVFVEPHWKTTLEAEATSNLLIPVDSGNIRQLRVNRQTGESKLLLEEEGNWRLASGPIRDLLDPEKMKRLLDTLSHLRIRETIRLDEIEDGKKSVLNEMGFSASEQIDLKIDYPDKRPSQRLLVGTGGPLSGTVYIQAPGTGSRKHIYIVDGDLRSFLDSPAENLRDRKVTRVHPSRIVSYILRTSFGEVELKRELKEQRWFLTRPIQARANDDIAYSLLEEVDQMEVESFIDDKTIPPLLSSGAMDPRTAYFELRTDQGKVIKLQLKENPSPNPDDTRMMAKINGREAILQIHNNLVSRLPNNVNQLRYPYLADIDPATAARIFIRSPNNPDVELRSLATVSEKKDGEQDLGKTKNWQVVINGKEEQANSGRINRLIEALNKERVLEYRSDTSSRLDAYGLTRPVATLSITSAGVDAEDFDQFKAAVQKAKEAGQPIDKIKAPDPVIATRILRFGQNEQILLNAFYENEPFIYGIDPSFLYTYLPTHPLNWRNLRLSAFGAVNVRKLEILPVGGPETRLYYDYYQAQWTGTLGGERIDDKIDPTKANRLANRLGSLEARQWLTQRAEAYQALDNYSFEVRMEIAPVEEIGVAPKPPLKLTVRFAPALISGDRITLYYGRFAGSPDVFDIPAEAVEQLLEPVLNSP